MSAGSLRGVTIDGIPFAATGDVDVALGHRIEKESIPHSSGNMIKRTLAAANAEAVKLTLQPTEYEILRGLADADGDIPLSYVMTDGSSFKTQGQINLGPYQTADSVCEITLMTSTGEWENFSAS